MKRNTTETKSSWYIHNAVGLYHCALFAVSGKKEAAAF